jgi:creatinine amidohydrolase
MFAVDLRETLRDAPVAYLPLGAPEVHGEHLTFGLDGIKAYELCKRVALKAGGAVLPPLHAGTQVPKSFNFGNIYISTAVAEGLYREYMQELIRVGFRAVVVMTGHYPGCQVELVKRLAADVMETHGGWIIALDECDLTMNLGCVGGHAGKWETSMYMHLCPDLVRMENLPEDLNIPLIAAGPLDPRVHASKELGEQLCTTFIERLTTFVAMLLNFDKDPMRHGPTHTQMRNALRAMAAFYAAHPTENPRSLSAYQQAAELFYAGKFIEAAQTLNPA